MALKIKRKNKVGIETEYHKIVSISASFDGEETSIRAVVAHYVNEEYRRKHITLDAEKTIFFASVHEDHEEQNLRSVVYKAMKETEEYAGAEDV